MTPSEFEKLGALFLGRPVSDPPSSEPLLVPAKHLVTHGVIVGMTGSGKTGLGAVLLEECAIDGIPAIVIDPKGDLGNLLLTFPRLDAASFAPWTPPGEDPAAIAQRHQAGLAQWGQDGARIERFASSCERALYTPGSSMGRRLSLMPSLGAPAPGSDEEALRERALTTASGLLALVGAEADPVQSPEHSLIATVLLHAWKAGRGMDLVSLLRELQTPPFTNLGAMPVESVIGTKDRGALAARLNNAFASPAMAGFLEGEPLDPARLLWTTEGRPKLSILSLAHLSDSDRMFFVTVLLGEVIAWMRAQSGTTSLRALLYMDEVFGYFPPVANPPSKTPMLTLLKQARAFGLGVVLATQNPVDLDYKGLANTGTWMLGRLQTERDKLRVLDGLEGASTASQAFDRARIDTLLSSLGQRRFLLHSVHEPAPRVFETRWALSYLRGPLSRDEVRRLAAPSPSSSMPSPEAKSAPAASMPGPASTPAARPILPAELSEAFLARADLPNARAYQAGILCRASLRYVDSKSGTDTWVTPSYIAPLGDDGPRWDQAWFLGMSEPTLEPTPRAGLGFVALPGPASRPASYKTWEKATVAHLARTATLTLWAAPEVELHSRAFETREAFLARLGHSIREKRDAEIEKLLAKWQPKLDKAQDKVAKAERKLEAARSASSVNVLTSGLEIGASVLGSLLGGRRPAVASNASRVARGARSAARGTVTREHAQAELDEARLAAKNLEVDVAGALDAIRTSWQPGNVLVEERPVAPKRSEIRIERFGLVWVPVA